MTWDKALFPQPEQMQDNIASRGRKIVTIVDPHIKRDPAYPVFKNAEEAGHYVKNKDGKDYDGCAALPEKVPRPLVPPTVAAQRIGEKRALSRMQGPEPLRTWGASFWVRSYIIW